jgi:hypothetical protein
MLECLFKITITIYKVNQNKLWISIQNQYNIEGWNWKKQLKKNLTLKDKIKKIKKIEKNLNKKLSKSTRFNLPNLNPKEKLRKC